MGLWLRNLPSVHAAVGWLPQISEGPTVSTTERIEVCNPLIGEADGSIDDLLGQGNIQNAPGRGRTSRPGGSVLPLRWLQLVEHPRTSPPGVRPPVFRHRFRR